jgi:hypothetical protein
LRYPRARYVIIENIITYLTIRITNAAAAGLNSKIQK